MEIVEHDEIGSAEVIGLLKVVEWRYVCPKCGTFRSITNQYMFQSADYMDADCVDIGKRRRASDEDFALSADTKRTEVTEGHAPCVHTVRCPTCKTQGTITAWITTQYCYRLSDGELGIEDASFADDPEDMAFAELAVLENTFVRSSGVSIEVDDTVSLPLLSPWGNGRKKLAFRRRL